MLKQTPVQVPQVIQPEPVPVVHQVPEESNFMQMIEEESKKPVKVAQAKQQLPDLAPLRRGGQGALDVEFLQQQKKNAFTANAFKEFDDFESEQSKKPQEDGRSMADVLREKREQTEKALAEKQVSQVESAEERRRRLQANRDLLIKQKQEKRERELAEFQTKTQTGNKDDLHQALLEIDKKAKAKATTQADVSGQDDKRMQMYKNMRDELVREESKAKTDQQKQKIEDLNAKMQQLDLQRQEREERDALA